jgi:glutathione S-transferase
MLQLHFHPDSTFARRVRIALLEKNIAHELVEVNLAAGQQRSDAFRHLNLGLPHLPDIGLTWP